jgi:hypothetical protein
MARDQKRRFPEIAVGVGAFLALLSAAGMRAQVGSCSGGGSVTHTTSCTYGVTSTPQADCPFEGFVLRTETTVVTTSSLGPGTIMIGGCAACPDGNDCDGCGPCPDLEACSRAFSFLVAAGTANLNTNTHTQTFVCVPLGVSDVEIPTLSARGLALAATGLAVVGIARLRRR